MSLAGLRPRSGPLRSTSTIAAQTLSSIMAIEDLAIPYARDWLI